MRNESPRAIQNYEVLREEGWTTELAIDRTSETIGIVITATIEHYQ